MRSLFPIAMLVVASAFFAPVGATLADAQEEEGGYGDYGEYEAVDTGEYGESSGGEYGAASGEDDSVPYAGVYYILSKSRDEIVIPEDIPEYHTVVPGDTLWDISGMYLYDNYLWPLIWERNLDHIPNPHLIYPDQLVYLPQPFGGMGTPGEGAALAGTGDGDGEGEGDDLFGLVDDEAEVEDAGPMKIRPVLTKEQMEHIGYVSPGKKKSNYKIIGAEMYDQFQLACNDVVYVDVGRIHDAKVGDEFFIYNYKRKVFHPKTGKMLGWYVNNFGVLKLVCVFEKNAMAVIEKCFEPIKVGDLLAPYAEIPSPWLRETTLDKCKVPEELNNGYVVDTKLNPLSNTDNVFAMEDEIVYIDLGYTNNVAVGDYFMMYFERPKNSPLPELAIGELIVLYTTETTSTCYITKAIMEIELGTAVDYISLTKADLEGVESVAEEQLQRGVMDREGALQ